GPGPAAREVFHMPENFGARLRQQRESRQIPLEVIAAQTKINLSLLEGLERDDVSRWPMGIFRRAFVRDYARLIGLEPEPVVREFLELHPDPFEQAEAAAGSDPAAAGLAGPPRFGRLFSRLRPAAGPRAAARAGAAAADR